MAIYHFNMRSINRRGQNALAATAYQSGVKITSTLKTASYQSGEKLNDHERGDAYEYGRAERVFATGIELPEELNEEAKAYFSDRERLWNAVEDVEKSERAFLAERIILALPRELDRDQAKELMESYCQALSNEYGVAVDWAIHSDATEYENSSNPHAHILMHARPFNLDRKDFFSEDPLAQFASGKSETCYICQNVQGEEKVIPASVWQTQKLEWEKTYNFYDPEKAVYFDEAKTKINWKRTHYERHTLKEGEQLGLKRKSKFPCNVKDSPFLQKRTPKEAIRDMRRGWARVCNTALKKAGSNARVDERSFVERGIFSVPTIHRGLSATNIDRKATIKAKMQAFNALTPLEKKKIIEEGIKNSRSKVGKGVQRLNTKKENVVASNRGVRFYAMQKLQKFMQQTEYLLTEAQKRDYAEQALKISKAFVEIPAYFIKLFFLPTQLYSMPQVTKEIEHLQGLKSFDLPVLQGEKDQIHEAERIRARSIRSIPSAIRQTLGAHEKIQDLFNKNTSAKTWIDNKLTVSSIIKTQLIPLENEVDGQAQILQCLKENPIRKQIKIEPSKARAIEVLRHNTIKRVFAEIPKSLLNNKAFVKELVHKIEHTHPRFWVEHKQDAHIAFIEKSDPTMTLEILDNLPENAQNVIAQKGFSDEFGEYKMIDKGKWTYVRDPEKTKAHNDFRREQEKHQQKQKEKKQKEQAAKRKQQTKYKEHAEERANSGKGGKEEGGKGGAER